MGPKRQAAPAGSTRGGAAAAKSSSSTAANAKGVEKERGTRIEEQFQEAQEQSTAVWLNTAGRSISPHFCIKAAQEAILKQESPWLLGEDDETPLRELFSKLIPTALPEDIAIASAASTHLSTLAYNFQEQWRNEDTVRKITGLRLDPIKRLVLVVEEQYTSNVYPWQELLVREQTLDVDFLVVKTTNEDDDLTDLVIQAYKMQKKHVKLVALMQSRWIDGRMIDLQKVAAELAEDCYFVLDLTQSLGVIPVPGSVARRADAIVCTTHKWLLGLYGISLMYVNSSRKKNLSLQQQSTKSSHAHSVLRTLDHHERNRIGCVDGACLPFLLNATGKRDELSEQEVESLSPARFLGGNAKAGGAAARARKSLSDAARMSLVPLEGPATKKAKKEEGTGSPGKNNKASPSSPKAKAQSPSTPEIVKEKPPICEVFEKALYEPAFRAGAGLRLDMGGRPGNPIVMPALLASLDLIINHWKVETIQKKCEELMKQLKEEIRELNAEIEKKSLSFDKFLQITYPKHHSPHIIGLRFGAMKKSKKSFELDTSVKITTEKAHQRLSNSGIHTSYRSGYIRVSLYVYNTPADVTRLVRCLKVYLFDALTLS
ncbi:unnamed protein product [Amoebophrya sp. A120]|nr:unnamed protein product [Amoebophrya sp. A120]|eukprot:GSA120T00002918001.1